MDQLPIDLTTLTVIGVLLSALAGTITKLFYMLIASKDKEIQTVIAQMENYRSIAMNSLRTAEIANNKRREALNQPPLEILAPVVPEHNSPVTDTQQHIADLATERARLTAITLDLGLPPRTEESNSIDLI